MTKQFDLDELYENLTDAVRNGECEHGAALDMFRDFIEDTLMIKAELELTQHEIDILKTASQSLKVASTVTLFKGFSCRTCGDEGNCPDCK